VAGATVLGAGTAKNFFAKRTQFMAENSQKWPEKRSQFKASPAQNGAVSGRKRQKGQRRAAPLCYKSRIG